MNKEDKRHPSDSARDVGGTVARSFGGKIRSVPKVTQSTFDEEGELGVERQANTGKGLRPLDPLRRAGIQVGSPGKIDPNTARLAANQERAIDRNTGRKGR